MTKLVSFFLFLAAFIWTWFLFNSKSEVNVGVHAGLQSKLALMIEETVKTHKPNSFGFKMQSIYTKTIDANKVAAYYKYNFSEKLADGEVTLQTIDGEAILNRTLSENPNDEKWVVQSVKTQNPVVEFQEGVIIGSGEAATAGTDAAQATAAASGDGTPASAPSSGDTSTASPPQDNTQPATEPQAPPANTTAPAAPTSGTDSTQK